MEEIKKLSGTKKIVHTAELLLSARGEYERILHIIVESALNVSGADRSCLIIGDKDALFIRAGLPLNAHGIGQRITRENGETFLRKVMNDDSIVLITNPLVDGRVAYMRDLVSTCGISSLLLLPLSSEGESIGVLVLDWVCGKKISKDVLEDTKLLGRLASKAIGMEYKGRKDREKILHDERLRVLGEHSSQVAHIIRNSLMVIGGFSGRLLKFLSNESNFGKPGAGGGFLDMLREDIGIIDSESKKLEGIANDVLNFTGVKNPVLESCNINRFLSEELSRIVLIGPKPILKLSKRLDGLNIAIDKQMFSICLHDLIRYAAEASASRIVIKTKLKPKQKELVVSVTHNGRRIHPHVMKDPFSPFVTSEINGSGLGLANVKSIITRHGGDISVLSGDTTEFTITLSLIKCNGSSLVSPAS